MILVFTFIKCSCITNGALALLLSLHWCYCHCPCFDFAALIALALCPSLFVIALASTPCCTVVVTVVVVVMVSHLLPVILLFALADCSIIFHCAILGMPLPLNAQLPPGAFHLPLVFLGWLLCHFLLCRLTPHIPSRCAATTHQRTGRLLGYLSLRHLRIASPLIMPPPLIDMLAGCCITSCHAAFALHQLSSCHHLLQCTGWMSHQISSFCPIVCVSEGRSTMARRHCPGRQCRCHHTSMGKSTMPRCHCHYPLAHIRCQHHCPSRGVNVLPSCALPLCQEVADGTQHSDKILNNNGFAECKPCGLGSLLLLNKIS